MRSAIVIPSYNRAHLIERAVNASLKQTVEEKLVVVIDDGSTDHTHAACVPFFSNPDFLYVRLGRNLGTAAAKNVALAIVPFDAVTFHDSDDVPHRDKVLRQVRTLERDDLIADPCLPWHINNKSQTAGGQAKVDLVLTAHTHIGSDGTSARVARTLSLVDDFFPGLQFGAGPLGDWVLINSGLFRRSILSTAGGFADGVEEDRDLRNRVLMHGANIWFIDEPLLTKFEQADSLTAREDTGYRSERRLKDRADVWQAVIDWKSSGKPPVTPISLPDIVLAFVSNPDRIRVADDIPMDTKTRKRLNWEFDRLSIVRP
jgi:glycosyltransferase involved in cell wall biosynthesis